MQPQPQTIKVPQFQYDFPLGWTEERVRRLLRHENELRAKPEFKHLTFLPLPEVTFVEIPMPQPRRTAMLRSNRRQAAPTN